MNLEQIVKELNLTVLNGAEGYEKVEPASGYTSDLLSCVMAGAKKQGVWITLQAHTNIVAVAALLDQAAVIITEDAQPDAATIKKAREEGITLFSTPLLSYEVCGRLWVMGLRTG